MSSQKEVIENWRKVPLTGIPWRWSTDYKTGDWRSFRPIIDQDKCIKCLTCYIHCPDESITVSWEDEDTVKKVEVNYDYCKGCGICAEECPVDAIEMIEEGEG